MRILPFALLALVALLGCGAEPPATCGAPGAARECPCPGRGPGVQECGPGGAWTACECPPWPDGGAPDAEAPDAPALDAETGQDGGAPADAREEPPGPEAEPLCSSVMGDCDGDPTNGCEAFIATDPMNCGRCGNACPASATEAATCEAFRCGRECLPGRAECDGNRLNGCEVNTRTDSMHCGACGAACAPAHGVGVCASGLCVLDRCTPGFANCDANSANGCETPTTTNDNCGACGRGCGDGRTCTGGICCAASETACGGACVQTSTSPANCGRCGVLCGAGRRCAGGLCVM